MSDRKPPAKTDDPACAARATCRADAARPWGRSATRSGLLLALVVVGLALAKVVKPAPAAQRKTYRFRGSRAEILSNCSSINGAPNGRAELLAPFFHTLRQTRGAAVTSRMPPESRDVRLRRRPIPPGVDPMNRVTTSLCTRFRPINLEVQ